MTVAVETDTSLQHVHSGLSGVLVLTEPATRDHRNQRLAKYVLVTAVDGVGAAPAGSLASRASAAHEPSAVNEDFSTGPPWHAPWPQSTWWPQMVAAKPGGADETDGGASRQ